MKQQIPPPPDCRSIFRDGGTSTTPERYTLLWLTLINRMERDKLALSGAR